MFHGKLKPKSSGEYLEKFVDEMKQLLDVGITISDLVMKINLKGFICDALAR